MRITRTLGVLTGLMAALLVLASPASASTSGINDWSCRPTSAHPSPVVLLHGMGANKDVNWSTIGPALQQQGYCVYSLTYGQNYAYGPGGMKPIDTSAQQIKGFIDQVLSSTRAAEASLVGHSEGGLQALYVPKRFNYGGKIAKVVAFAPPTHGTTMDGIVTLGQILGGQQLVDMFTDGAQCGACTDMVKGSAFINNFTATPIAQAGVAYTVLATKYDTVATPPADAFVNEPGVTNLFVQDTCPNDPVGHVGMAADVSVTSIISNALDASQPVTCGYGAPF